MNTINKTFDPQTLADDLLEVRRIYARFFAGLAEADWDKPVKGSQKEWSLHETVAHLAALHGAGLESVKHALRGEPYIFVGLSNRYEFNAFNRKGIDEYLALPMQEVCAKVLDTFDESASIARNLTPDQAALTAQMSIYNRPVRVDEAFSIIIFHAGLAHSVQVTEPAGQPPLWQQLSAGFRHRVVERVMRAFSMLYRFDIGRSLRASLAFRIDGPDGGNWHVDITPQTATSGEGGAGHPSLVIHMSELAVLFQMLTGRLNLLKSLITGRLKLRGDLRLFLRMGSLFSVDARP